METSTGTWWRNLQVMVPFNKLCGSNLMRIVTDLPVPIAMWLQTKPLVKKYQVSALLKSPKWQFTAGAVMNLYALYLTKFTKCGRQSSDWSLKNAPPVIRKYPIGFLCTTLWKKLSPSYWEMGPTEIMSILPKTRSWNLCLLATIRQSVSHLMKTRDCTQSGLSEKLKWTKPFLWEWKIFRVKCLTVGRVSHHLPPLLYQEVLPFLKFTTLQCSHPIYLQCSITLGNFRANFMFLFCIFYLFNFHLYFIDLISLFIHFMFGFPASKRQNMILTFLVSPLRKRRKVSFSISECLLCSWHNLGTYNVNVINCCNTCNWVAQSPISARVKWRFLQNSFLSLLFWSIDWFTDFLERRSSAWVPVESVQF